MVNIKHNILCTDSSLEIKTLCFSVDEVSETTRLNDCKFLIQAFPEGSSDVNCPVLHCVTEWLLLIRLVCTCSFPGVTVVSVFRHFVLLERTEAVKQ